MDYPKNNLYYDEYNYEDEDNSKNKRKDEDISEIHRKMKHIREW